MAGLANHQNADEQNADEQNADQGGGGTGGVSAPSDTIPPIVAPLIGSLPGAPLVLMQGDYGEYLSVKIVDANGPVDVSGASSITLRLRGLYDSKDTIHAACAVTTNLTGGVHNEVAYLLADGDTDQAGDYALEVALVWSNGKVRTSNKLLVTILSD